MNVMNDNCIHGKKCKYQTRPYTGIKFLFKYGKQTQQIFKYLNKSLNK